MRLARPHLPFFFFFNDTATTEIYTLSLHDALPISSAESAHADRPYSTTTRCRLVAAVVARSEEHTSELQSQSNLVCRLLLEKKKDKIRRAAWRRRDDAPSDARYYAPCDDTEVRRGK